MTWTDPISNIQFILQHLYFISAPVLGWITLWWIRNNYINSINTSFLHSTCATFSHILVSKWQTAPKSSAFVQQMASDSSCQTGCSGWDVVLDGNSIVRVTLLNVLIFAADRLRLLFKVSDNITELKYYSIKAVNQSRPSQVLLIVSSSSSAAAADICSNFLCVLTFSNNINSKSTCLRVASSTTSLILDTWGCSSLHHLPGAGSDWAPALMILIPHIKKLQNPDFVSCFFFSPCGGNIHACFLWYHIIMKHWPQNRMGWIKLKNFP